MSDQVDTGMTSAMEIGDQEGAKKQESFDEDMEKQEKHEVDEKMKEFLDLDIRSESIPKKLFDDYNKETRRKIVAGKLTSKIRNVVGTIIMDDNDSENYKIRFEKYLFELCDEKARTTINSKNLLKVILYSASEGLMHFHEKGYTHRNICTENIVICEENGGYVGKISDLKMSKISTDSEISSDFPTSHCTARELIQKKSDLVGPTSDVFSMGVVFYFALTREYPYDKPDDICNDSYTINFDLLKKEYELDDWEFFLAEQLVKSMLSHDPEMRPTMKQVMNHPFFWNLTKKEHFLMTASQYIQGEDPTNSQKTKKKKTNKEMEELNKKLNTIFTNWLNVVDKALLLNWKQKIGYKNTASDLLRFLRNFPTHYAERKNEIQRKFIAKEGAVKYCLEKIPIFFIHFYSYFNDAPHSEYDTLRKFYCDCYLSNMFADHYCGEVDGSEQKKKFTCYKWVEEEII